MFQRLFTAEQEEERPKAAKEEPEQTAQKVAAPAEASHKSAAADVPSVETTKTVGLQQPSHEGLIPASNLPPAADALAQLFAETDPAEERRGGDAAQPEKILDSAETKSAPTNAEPKRRGIFARLLMFKKPSETRLENPVAVTQNSTEEKQGETAAGPVTRVVAAGATEIPTGATIESSVNAATDTARAPETTVAAIPAEELPSAAHALAELFPPDETSQDATASVAVQLRQEEAAKDVAEVPVEALVEVLANASAESVLEERTPELPVAGESHRDERRGEFGPDTLPEVQTGKSLVGTARGDVRLGSRESEWPYETPGGAVTATTIPENASEQSQGERPAETLDEQVATAPAPLIPQRMYKDWAFDEKLASHREWVESHGQTGQRADLAGAQLEASDLISVNLRLADLHDANLRASDMLLADLRDACMVRADLEEACLVGANMEGANLEGASLETAMGLVPRQFAGANLRDALLSPQLMEFEAVTAFERSSQNAFRYFGLMTAASVLSWLVIWRTRDVQLLTDSAIIPFLHSHAAAAALPTAESYLIVPVVLLILYLLFHFHLQRLWDAVLELPAIFPDGHTLGDSGPGIITGLLRTHFRWMNPDPSSTRLVEKGVSLLAAYWIVPATLLLFWARYLTRQEIHGTILQALLVVVAVGVAAYATTKVGRAQERWAFEKKWTTRCMAGLKAISPVTVTFVLGVVLILLSAGIVAGVPHDRSRAPQYGATSIRRWAANAFWWLAFDPYPDLTEASISQRPANWSGADDLVGSVDGLRANNAKFRYAQAYGAFLANAHLWRADFQGAFLSEADMRGADLGQSNMRFAVMDHAQMNHANLDRSNLDGADLRRADLRDANLSYSSLTDAILVDARLDGANLYTTRLPGATLTRAILEKADLRESYLGGAHMDHADLRNAYLWSAKLPSADLGGAQLGSAILIDADLHGANLGGAQLTGTVLNGADLTGTSLEGADLRGALGLSANQVCSAKSRRGVVLDPEMQTQVEAQCGK
jgi:uncharacterized protein YjbI with pentapeptide repeats